MNYYGDGQAYYIGARTGDDFLATFYTDLLEQLNISSNSSTKSSQDVSVQTREAMNGTVYYFAMNFSNQLQSVELSPNLVDVSTGQEVETSLDLQAFEVKVFSSRT